MAALEELISAGFNAAGVPDGMARCDVSMMPLQALRCSRVFSLLNDVTTEEKKWDLDLQKKNCFCS